jgi:hypothetical protein
MGEAFAADLKSLVDCQTISKILFHQDFVNSSHSGFFQGQIFSTKNNSISQKALAYREF